MRSRSPAAAKRIRRRLEPRGARTLPVGAVAPGSTLPSTAGTDVTLSEFRGRRHVLLAFFPLAFTSTCTAENCAFSEDYDAFERAGTIVLPISVDSVPTLKEYKAKHAMRQDLLSDFKREVSRTYRVLLEDRFFSKRAYFLIDRQGILRWRHIEAELGARRDTLFRAARVRGQVVRTLVEVPVEFSAAPMPAIKMHIAGDVYRETDVEERPHLMSGPPLAYPAPMLLSRISGRVIIEAVIDTTGRVEDGTVRVLVSSDARFNEAAKDYVRAARFTPGRLAGSAVRVRFEMPVEFKPPTRN